MRSFRGEEQPGFLDLVGTWLSQQSWFKAAPGRRVITRVGGLRLPAPEGEPDQRVHLELHVFLVEHAAGQERLAVPMALRSRPSALAGKAAFIGRLRAADGDLWVYDGAHDRAFLAAIHEMVRRGQGSRNGRSRGQAFEDFADWPAFSATLQRTVLEPPTAAMTRTAITLEAGTGQDQRTIIDFPRRPDQRSGALDTVVRMGRTGSRTVSRVLGVVTGTWPEADSEAAEQPWVSCDLGVIREASLGAPAASAQVDAALLEASDFQSEAEQIGRTLGNFHADLAGTFGAYPQTDQQRMTTIDQAVAALEHSWSQVHTTLEESEADVLGATVDRLITQLRETDQAMSLQKIHGALNLERIRAAGPEGPWIIDEQGGMSDHALPLRDVVAVLISIAELTMQRMTTESTPESTPASAQTPRSAQADVSELDGELWCEQVTTALLQGYRHSDAAEAGLDSTLFHAAVLTEALDLVQRSEGRWIFGRSLALNPE